MTTNNCCNPTNQLLGDGVSKIARRRMWLCAHRVPRCDVPTHAKHYESRPGVCAPRFHHIDEQISCSEQRPERGLRTRTSWHKIVTLFGKIARFVLINHEWCRRDENSFDELAIAIHEFHATNAGTLPHFETTSKVELGAQKPYRKRMIEQVRRPELMDARIWSLIRNALFTNGRHHSVRQTFAISVRRDALRCLSAFGGCRHSSTNSGARRPTKSQFA